jgi:hypothetical protein
MISSRARVRAFSPRHFMPQLLLYLALVSLVLGLVSTARAEQDGKHSSAQPIPYLAALNTEGLPIAFEPNLKQAGERYKFLTHQNGLVMGFLDHNIELRLATRNGNPDVLGISFEGSQSSAASAEKLLPGRVNYLRGSDPAAFQRNVPTYARVRYTSLYPAQIWSFTATVHGSNTILCSPPAPIHAPSRCASLACMTCNSRLPAIFLSRPGKV